MAEAHVCHHTLQSSPARDGRGSSGNALQALCGAHAEVQVLRSLRQPASQETVALFPLCGHGVALEWYLKASDEGQGGWEACQTKPGLGKCS